MSIQSEITRISGNVTDSLTAVANKGVTVPSGSNSDDLAGLIALIPTGGGGSVTQDQDGFIVLPPTGGGSSGNWSWMGENPTKVSTITSEKEYLENTAYATWTPSTTSTTLSASTNLTAVTGLDFSSYDYILYGKFHTHYEYGQGATGTAQPADYYANVTPVAFGIFTNLSSMNSGTTNSITYMNTSVASGLFYKNTSGADAFTTSYYGVYVSVWDAISSLTSGNIIPRTPKISAMCSNNQFSTTNASEVDQTKSYYEYKLELWRVDAGTSHIYYYSHGIRDMWLNGF